MNFSDVPGEAVLRQRFDKNFTILHALNAVVQNGQNTAISATYYIEAVPVFTVDESGKVLSRAYEGNGR